MSNPVTPLNLPAVALSVLQTQTRSTGTIDALSGALESERQAVDLVQRAGESLARTASQGNGPIPRGQFINILV
jgi:hypothetical protein